MGILKHIRILLVVLCLTLVGGLAILLGPGQGKAAVAGTYQMPCYPNGSPNYNFGQYISGWGYHVGEDICHSAGIPVYAIANGTVVYSARTPDSYRWGNLIMIEHTNDDGNKVVSLYGHLNDDRRVAAGQTVSKGQPIGVVGQRGNSNGNWDPHLHFGIHPGAYGAATGTYAWWVHGYENTCCGGWVDPSDYISLRVSGYDSVPFDTIGGGGIFYNSEIQVTFRVRNTGAFTWRKDGNSSTPVRLGTVGPRDRGSAFSANGTAPGWVGANRIKLDSDTPTGELATFTATLRSNQVPNPYVECFSPVVDGVGWMTERPICVGITVLPPQWRGEWYSQMITTNSDPMDLTGQASGQYLTPGQKLNLKLLVKNVGELPWEKSGTNYVRLSTSRPLDRASAFATGGDGTIPLSENWSWYNRPSEIDGRYVPGSNTVVADDSITNGEIAVFSFTITAPQQPGSYQEYFNPVAEGHYHTRDLAAWFGLRVVDLGYHYEWVTQTLTPGSVGQTTTTQDATLRIRNSGREAWPVDGDVRLGTDRPRDYNSWLYTPSGTGAWIGANRLSAIDQNVTSPGKSTVDPGEVAEFSMRFTIPTNVPAGNYQFYVRPLKEGATWFPEDYGVHFPITITVPPHNYQVVYQSFSGDPNAFSRNSTMTATLGIKNTGRDTWETTGPRITRLGTSRPNDRASGFANLSDSDPWLSLNRASGIDGKVTNLNPFTTAPATEIQPGEIGWFNIPLKANADPGTYSEYLNLVEDGFGWFPDYGIFFPLRVIP